MLEISIYDSPFKAIEMSLPIPLILNNFLCFALLYFLNYGNLALGFAFSLHCLDFREMFVIVWTRPYNLLMVKLKGQKVTKMGIYWSEHTHLA